MDPVVLLPLAVLAWIWWVRRWPWQECRWCKGQGRYRRETLFTHRKVYRDCRHCAGGLVGSGRGEECDEEEAVSVQLSFCERSTATAMSREHIRIVGAEGVKLGGGAPDTTLCGRPLLKGWDLQAPVDVAAVTQLGSPRQGDGRVFLCEDCRDEALRLLS